jgi:CDP-2,3-bis-(O-geranylgeranyl)-sn-glycerol synthase
MTLLKILQVLYFFGPAYAADVSPLFAREFLPRLGATIDGGRTLGGKPILGGHKTWRGLLACVLAGIVVWEAQRALYAAGWLRSLSLVDYSVEPLVPGLLMGLGAGLGDAAKSFFKRRMGMGAGETWLGFDQLDFFVGALVLVSLVHVPPLGAVLVCLPIVFVCDIAATTIFWLVGLKESWI